MLVTKIDAARRQLTTAIRLFFDGGDPVSVYSLASNAWEVTILTGANRNDVTQLVRWSMPLCPSVACVDDH